MLMPGKSEILYSPDGTPTVGINHVAKQQPDNERPRYHVEPTHTVVTNIDNGFCVGTSWEFFGDELTAKACAMAHNSKPGRCSTLRPFFNLTDRQHMGAAHSDPINQAKPDQKAESKGTNS